MMYHRIDVVVPLGGSVKPVVLRTSVSVNLVLMVVSVTMMYHHIDVVVPLGGSVKPVVLRTSVSINLGCMFFLSILYHTDR
jgi:hypothetical protein